MAKNLALIGVIIIVGFVVYNVISNLTAQVTFKGLKWNPFKLEAPPPVSSKSPTSSPQSSPPPPSLTFISKAKEEKRENEAPKITPPFGFELGDLSIYFHKIRIASAQAPRNLFERGQFTLKAEHNLSEGINVTGWKIKTNSGREIFISRAIADYTPTNLPPEGDIILYPENYLNVYGWSNASFGGKNFRLNKCMGYLNSFYNFDPRLPQNCPTPNQSEIITFSGRCQNFIRSLGSCEVPTANQLNSFSGPADTSCRAYLEKLNYGYCYETNRHKNDFFSNEWRVWLNLPLPFDSEHDRLLLFDKAGKLVDEYVY